MPRHGKEELKSIKIAASTHARLSLLSSIFEASISDVIDELLTVAYPEIVGEADKMLEKMDSLREVLEQKRSSQVKAG